MSLALHGGVGVGGVTSSLKETMMIITAMCKSGHRFFLSLKCVFTYQEGKLFSTP